MKLAKHISILLSVILLFSLSGCGGSENALSGISSVISNEAVSSAEASPDTSNAQNTASEVADQFDFPKDVVNIAILGIDSRSTATTDLKNPVSGRSDAVMIASINTKEKTIKLTSVLRDSWVAMKDRNGNDTHNKLNAAYAFGGAENAVLALNTNFGLNITDYVTISMHQMKNVVDIMGGVDINISEMERTRINHLANDEGFKADIIEAAGSVHLNGTQTISYTRIRDDGDDNRVLRQQRVMKLLWKKLKKLSADKYPALLKEILRTVNTSLSFDEILKFAPLLSNDDEIPCTSVPGKGVSAKGGVFSDTKGGWVWKYDLKEATNYIRKWIYNI